MIAMIMRMTFMMTHISFFLFWFSSMINSKSINVLLHPNEINDICYTLSVLLSKRFILLLCIYGWLYLWESSDSFCLYFSISIFIFLVKITSCFSQISCFFHFNFFLFLLTFLLQKFGQLFTIFVARNSFQLFII